MGDEDLSELFTDNLLEDDSATTDIESEIDSENESDCEPDDGDLFSVQQEMIVFDEQIKEVVSSMAEIERSIILQLERSVLPTEWRDPSPGNTDDEDEEYDFNRPEQENITYLSELEEAPSVAKGVRIENLEIEIGNSYSTIIYKL